MSFLEYLEEKYIFIAINLIALIISFFILLGLNVDNYAVIFIFMIILIKENIIKIY